MNTDKVKRMLIKRTVKGLIKALEDDSDYARKVAIEALGEIKDPRSVESLIRALGRRDFDVVHEAAAKALGELKEPRAVDPLIKTLGYINSGVRIAAVKALENLGESKWKEIVKGEDGNIIRLGQSNDPRAVEPLAKFLDDGSWTRRKIAAEALLKILKNNPEFIIGDNLGSIANLIQGKNEDYKYGSNSDCSTTSHMDTGTGINVN